MAAGGAVGDGDAAADSDDRNEPGAGGRGTPRRS
jgi:hypothetical protein